MKKKKKQKDKKKKKRGKRRRKTKTKKKNGMRKMKKPGHRHSAACLLSYVPLLFLFIHPTFRLYSFSSSLIQPLDYKTVPFLLY